MKFEQQDHVCTWMTNQHMKQKLEFQICEFLDFFQEFDFNFDFGLLRNGLINGFDAYLRV
jgi:hypothetical protein